VCALCQPLLRVSSACHAVGRQTDRLGGLPWCQLVPWCQLLAGRDAPASLHCKGLQLPGSGPSHQ